MSGRKKARYAGGARSAPKGRTWTQRFVGAHPFSTHSASRIPRGSDQSLALFGPTYATATDAQKALRREARMIGNGGYMADMAAGARTMWDASRGFRQGLGRAARAGYFGKIGRGLGGISRMLGTGEYYPAAAGGGPMVANSLVAGGLAAAGLPQFAPEQQEYHVSKVEYLTGVYAPTNGAFQNTVYPLQPGLQETFPWLALVAAQFEEYEFKQLMFSWRPMVSDFNSGTGQVGEIIMSTQYNPDDEPFTDVLRAQSYHGAMSSKTSSSMLHGVECNPALNSGSPGKNIRVGPLQPGQDSKQYDLGNLNVIVNGTPSGYNNQLLGQIWCAYTVVLRKPKLPDSTGDTILRDYFQSGTTPSWKTYPGQPAPTPGAGSFALTPGSTTSGDTWTKQPTLRAQQNRIGGAIETSTAAGQHGGQMYLKYVFPDWYTGDVELTYTIFQPRFTNKSTDTYSIQTPLTWASNCGNIGDLTESTNVWSLNISSTSPVSGSPGNVFPWAYANENPPGPTSIMESQVTIKVHLRVSGRTDGSENSITFTFDSGLQTDAPIPYNGTECQAWTLDVTEYNSGFNRHGVLELVDLVTGAPAQSPY